MAISARSGAVLNWEFLIGISLVCLRDCSRKWSEGGFIAILCRDGQSWNLADSVQNKRLADMVLTIIAANPQQRDSFLVVARKTASGGYQAGKIGRGHDCEGDVALHGVGFKSSHLLV